MINWLMDFVPFFSGFEFENKINEFNSGAMIPMKWFDATHQGSVESRYRRALRVCRNMNITWKTNKHDFTVKMTVAFSLLIFFFLGGGLWIRLRDILASSFVYKLLLCRQWWWFSRSSSLKIIIFGLLTSKTINRSCSNSFHKLLYIFIFFYLKKKTFVPFFSFYTK